MDFLTYELNGLFEAFFLQESDRASPVTVVKEVARSVSLRRASLADGVEDAAWTEIGGGGASVRIGACEALSFPDALGFGFGVFHGFGFQRERFEERENVSQ